MISFCSFGVNQFANNSCPKLGFSTPHILGPQTSYVVEVTEVTNQDLRERDGWAKGSTLWEKFRQIPHTTAILNQHPE